MDEDGLTLPVPFVERVTRLALLNVLPLMVAGDVPQTLVVVLGNVMAGPFTQPHDTRKLKLAVHPAAFLTVIVWLPLTTLVNVVLV